MVERLGDVLGTRSWPPLEVVAVVAHPDDETFGLGAILATLASAGSRVRVVCLTHGEASSLGGGPGLGEQRRRELQSAAEVLGVAEVFLYDLGDGHLVDLAVAVLDGLVETDVDHPDLLVTFEPGGVTGHPDHRAAAAAARRAAARRALPVLEWGVNPDVARVLNDELGTTFTSLTGEGVHDVTVDRSAQYGALTCHASQVSDNAALARRLELQGPTERVRFIPVLERVSR